MPDALADAINRGGADIERDAQAEYLRVEAGVIDPAEDRGPTGLPPELTDEQDHAQLRGMIDMRSAADWAGVAVPEQQFVIDQWIPRRQTTALYGDGGAGKSLLAQMIATCIAAGRDFCGHKCTHGAVLAFFCEDEEGQLHKRQDDINRALGLDYSDIDELKWTSRVGEDNLLMVFDGKDAGTLTQIWHCLDEWARYVNPELIIVDTAADTFGGNENNRSQVRQYIQCALTSLAVKHDCAALVLAHPSVAGLQSGEGTGGSTAWNNSVRSRLYLYRDKEEGTTTLERMKANYASTGEQIELQWREGAFYSVGDKHKPFADASEAVCDAFLVLLKDTCAQGRDVSDARQGKFAPREFAAMQRDYPFKHTATQYESAMNSLFKSRQIRQVPKRTGQSKRIEITPESPARRDVGSPVSH